MKRDTKVSWVLNGHAGHGITITDESDDGHVLVAILSEGELHPVIYCNVTWLQAEDDAEAKS